MRLRLRQALLALTVACMIGLAASQAAGVGSGVMTKAIGGVFAVAYVALVLVDFRCGVAVAIFELLLGGASGQWLDYSGGLTGRVLMDGIVTLRAGWLTIADWRLGRPRVLGRYGAHALAIAFLVPAIWMPLGLINGNAPRDVVADGDGFLFFSFVLVVATLLRGGAGAWFRRLFFAACATNGAAYLLLIFVTKAGVVSLATVSEWLDVRLAMGGVIGYMPGGHYRLFTAGSLFVVIGLVLTAQRLMVRPLDGRLWILACIFGADLVATYTRGLWLAALVGVVLVVAFEVRGAKQLALAVGVPVAAAGLALAIATLGGLSLYGYVSTRAATIVAASSTRRGVLADPGFEGSLRAWGTAGGRSLRVLRSATVTRSGRHSLELSNTAAGRDAYVFQDLTVQPNRQYTLSAWVNAQDFHQAAAGGRGLLAWDAADGLLYTLPLTSKTHGWQHLTMTFQTRPYAQDLQIRLYAPQGHTYWDTIHLAARGAVETTLLTAPQSTGSAGTSAAAQTMALASMGGGDDAGAASNSYRIAEARALLHYIRRRPIYGYGFGKVASNFSTGYSYELSYLDLLLKAGVVGLLLYLSFPLRLIIDAVRLRRRAGRRLDDAEAAGGPGVVVGVVAAILVAGATNPYLFAAFGLISIVAMVAWLDGLDGFVGSARKSDALVGPR